MEIPADADVETAARDPAGPARKRLSRAGQVGKRRRVGASRSRSRSRSSRGCGGADGTGDGTAGAARPLELLETIARLSALLVGS